MGNSEGAATSSSTLLGQEEQGIRFGIAEVSLLPINWRGACWLLDFREQAIDIHELSKL